MKYLLLLPLLLGLSSSVNAEDSKLNINSESSKSQVSNTYNAWCGKIGKFEPSDERPKCFVQFVDDYLIINEVLKISNSQITNIKYNLVCITAPLWETCSDIKAWGSGKYGPTIKEKYGDKRFTLSYKTSNLTPLTAIITFREWKTSKNFKKELKNWGGDNQIVEGGLIRHIK